MITAVSAVIPRIRADLTPGEESGHGTGEHREDHKYQNGEEVNGEHLPAQPEKGDCHEHVGAQCGEGGPTAPATGISL